MDLKAAITEEKDYTLRCADEETYEKVKRAIEKMDSEDSIIKVEMDTETNNVTVSLNGDQNQLLTALGCTIESMIKSAGIHSFLISGLVVAAITRSECKEGSEEK